GATVRDASIGGSKDFNRFDGFLMALKDHAAIGAPAPPAEYLYSWWYPVDSAGALTPGVPPCFRGKWAPDTCSIPRTATQIANWDARTRVHGITSSDAQPDTGYTVEMRFSLGPMGYDITKPGGDIVEWNISIYDTDWMWPLNLSRFSANRAWIESPWGNAMWYDEVHLYARPDVTIGSGPLPAIAADVTIPDAGTVAAPTIDGRLTEPAWARAPGFDIRYDDTALRRTYPY